ncbi:Alkaline phosphatase, partial [hydrothermal vent metagenome]
ANLNGATTIMHDNQWLYASGSRKAFAWNPSAPCNFFTPLDTAARPETSSAPSNEIVNTITAVNLFDSVVTRNYSFTSHVLDHVAYGDYLIVALGGSGLEIFHKERSETRTQFSFAKLMTTTGDSVRLKRMGSTLFVSAADGGVVVLDIQDPMNPYVLSAGNDEHIDAIDVYKDRLVAATGKPSISLLQLPQSLVVESSIDENGIIALGESVEIRFNENMSIASLQESGAITITRFDDTSTNIAFTVLPVDEIDASANRFAIDFTREQNVRYKLNINRAQNLRSTGLWAPYTLTVTAAPDSATRPVISNVANGLYHRGSAENIIITGQRFSATAKVFVDQFEIAATYVSTTELQIPAGALDLLPLITGSHHLRVLDGNMQATAMGSIVITSDLTDVVFTISPDAGGVKGGLNITIDSSADAILPASKIVLRSRANGDEIRSGDDANGVIDLEDDVVTLKQFKFQLPGVVFPGIYDVYLSMVDGEAYIGEFSYRLDNGSSIGLPNYPPMVMGGAAVRNTNLFVGVKEGANPTDENRFLMTSGLEIYDIAIQDRPIRLSQLRTEQPVTGIALLDQNAYLASGRDGLVIVDISDRENPLRITNFPVSGHIATDVDIHPVDKTLAMSVANELGTGYVRFFDLTDNELEPPYGSITFIEGELQGQPVDVQWLGNELYVLLKRDSQLYIVVFSDLGGLRNFQIHAVNRGTVDGITDASFVVQYGQIVLSVGNEYIIMQKDNTGTYNVIYWQDALTQSTYLDVFSNQGDIFLGGSRGVEQVSTLNLALTSISPAAGQIISKQDVIRLQFNQLINTDATNISAAIQILNATQAPLSENDYILEAINTLNGGYVEIQFSDALSYSGAITISLNTSLTNLEGTNLLEAFSADYILNTNDSLKINDVNNAASGLHFVHANGTEQVRITGTGFGADSNAIVIRVGDVTIASTDILSIDDAEIVFNLPDLFLVYSSASLSVTVERSTLSATRVGALVMLPRATIEDISPQTGTPQGGNTVDIFGRGFSQYVTVTFGNPVANGRVAGGLIVHSANHISVTAPAGSFGYVDINVNNRLFIGENSVIPEGYFYAGKETGSVEIDRSAPAPVSAITLDDQVLYAVTGGGYEAIDRLGRVVGNPVTSTAQLIVADVSDPVNPEIIRKDIANISNPYHLNVVLPPDGFRAIEKNDDDLFIAGGLHFYHFDTTLATDPLLLADIVLPSTVTDVTYDDNLVYVTGEFGLIIYRLNTQRELIKVKSLDTTYLGGQVVQALASETSLFVLIPEISQVVELDLLGGEYNIVNRIALENEDSGTFEAVSMLLQENNLFVSTGRRASVRLYQLLPDNASTVVAELNLSYLLKNGDLFAGDLLLKGQTLYVAAGQGDLQLFDISPWLDNRYSANISLKHYFSVTGAVNSFAFGDDAIYAGTSFVYVDDVATENPLEVGAQIQTLGGGLNTIINDQFVITEQIPEARGFLNVNDAVEIQFNTLIDPIMIRDQGNDLIEITLSNQKIDGFVSAQINNSGSRLVFRPTAAFENGKEYRVTLFAGLESLSGQVLSEDYSFRFVATDENQHILQQVEPVFGGWQGGYRIAISGESLLNVQRVDIGEYSVIVDDFIEHRDSQIIIAAPALAQSPEENRVVGISLISNDLSDFQAAAFTYIADPNIIAVGKYDPETETLNTFDHTFQYGVSEFIGIEATGISAGTRVFINGLRQNNVVLRDNNTLTVRMPSSVLGDVAITLDNKFQGNDSLADSAGIAENTELKVTLVATTRLTKVDVMTRHDSLLVTASNASVEGVDSSTVNLYTTRDSETPVFLASIEVNDVINSAALSNQYIALNVGERQEIQIFDISNIYAPRLINTLLNPALSQHDDLQLFDDTFVSMDGGTLNVGYVRGADWLTHNLPSDRLDIKIDGTYIYLLKNSTVEVRTLKEAGIPLVTTYVHGLINPDSMLLNNQRLLLFGKSVVELNMIELVDNSTLGDLGVMQQIGDASILGSGISEIYALHGELFVAKNNNTLRVYELDVVDNLSMAISVSPRAEIFNITDLTRLDGITFDRDILEWTNLTDYQSVNIPLLNAYAIAPTLFLSEDIQKINIAVTGGFDEWQNVILDVRKESEGNLLSGTSNILGRDMVFTPIGDVYELGESYSIKLFNQPESNLDVAADIDLPWRLSSAPLFGIDEFRVLDVSPGSSLTSVQTNYVILGSDLQLVNRILFNDTEINVNDWSINAEGTGINLSANITIPGLYNLVVEQPGQRVVLTAAILVQQAITVNAINTNNTAGSNRISDSGNTLVTITGLGFAGPLDVHLYEANSGLTPGASNKVIHRLSGNDLQFITPDAIHGRNYQVVLIRNETSERIDIPNLLTGIDDTRPIINQITPLTFASALQITADEAITATSFNVVEQFRDYSNNADQDISNQFELAVIGNEIYLRTKLGVSLSNNRIYQLTIDGMQDLRGNTVVNYTNIINGRYTSSFTSSDLLSPVNHVLKRKRDNADVDAAMTLTRGRTYEFIPSVEDNLVTASDIRYEARVSTNNGLSFGGWKNLPSNECSGNTNNLCISILSSYEDIVIRLKAIDPSENFSIQDFSVRVIDPVINISTVFTEPTEVDELSRADIQFDLDGDVDLLNTATMTVLGVRYPVNIASTGTTTSRVSLSYIHPRLSEIAPSDQIFVTLELTYGFDDAKSQDDQYKLFLDITPPTINIVSPGDGDRIVLGDQTDVLFKVFDRFAIETVEASINGGAFTETAFPNRYTFTPLTLDSVTIAVRATDANGNVSTTENITVQPYDATLGEPTVAILSPANGSEFHEGEDVAFELQMLNVTDAQLFFDIGGIENDVRNPAPININRSADAASRFAFTTALPVVGENIVVVARLESGSLKARQFINLLKDDGISETPLFEISPSTTTLTGSKIMLRAITPADMTDFSESSVIEVNDPASNAAVDLYAYDGQTRYHHVSTTGTDIAIEAVLRDRSNFEKRIGSVLSKQAYFSDTGTALLQLAQNETLVSMVSISGINPTDDIFWALNKRDGGYSIAGVNETIVDENEGELLQFVSGGAGLFAEVSIQGQHRLLGWTIENGVLVQSIDQVINGNLIGVNGYQIFISNGQSVTAYILDQGVLLPVLGEAINERIISTFIDANRLFVLSESGIYIYHIDAANDVRLIRDAYLALPGMDGFSVNGNQLYSWSADRLYEKQLLPDFSLVDMNEIIIDGNINSETVIDGDIVWFLIENGESRWYGYQAGTLIAILDNNITAMLFDAAASYQLQTESNSSNIVKIDLIADNVATLFEPQLTELPLGILVNNIALDSTLGGEELIVSDQNDVRLPVTQVWQNSNRQWFIRRADLNIGELHIARVNRAGNTDVAVLNRNETAFSLTSQLQPANASVLTQGAIVPMTQTLDATARAEYQSVLINGQERRSITAGANGTASTSSQWFTLSEVDSDFVYEHLINGVSDTINSVTLLNNQLELDNVTISQPTNNSGFTEGQLLDIRYRVTENSDALNHVHLRLLDFNRVLISEVRLSNNNGKLQIRLPEVSEQTNILLNIRAYYGSEYRYSEKEVGLKINPQLSIPAFELAGLSRRVMQGSQLNISLDREIDDDLNSSLFVYDQNEQLLISDETQINYQIIDGLSRLSVQAMVADDFGNERVNEQFIDVIDHFRFIDQIPAVSYNSVLPGVGSSYFAQGRILTDNTGQALAEFNSTITAMAHLGDRVILALENIGLIVVNPFDALRPFRQLSNEPLTGRVSKMLVKGETLAVIVDGKLRLYDLDGNAIEPTAYVGVDGTVLDVISHQNAFVALSNQQLAIVNDNGSIAKTITERFTAMVKVNEDLLLSSATSLWLVNSQFTKQALPARVNADKLLLLGGDVIALNNNGEMRVIDIREISNPDTIGYFEIATTDVSRATIAQGQLWLGGNAGQHFTLQRQSDVPRILYQDSLPRGIIQSVALKNGFAIGAADYYGSQIINIDQSNGQRVLEYYPEPRTGATHDIVVNDEIAYLRQDDTKQIIVYNLRTGEQSPTAILAGRDYSAMTSTSSYLVVSSGSELYFVNHLSGNAPPISDALTIEPGNAIVALTSRGDTVYASTQSGVIYRIRVGALPIADANIDIEVLIATNGSARQIITNGDYLMYAIGADLHRLRLLDKDDRLLTFPSNVGALAVTKNRLFVGVDADVNIVNISDWSLTGNNLSGTGGVSAIAAENNRLLIGRTDAGLELIELPLDWYGVNAALAMPHFTKKFEKSDDISLLIQDAGDIATVDYLINGDYTASQVQAPFEHSFRTPAQLRNGQPFDIRLNVETIWGELSQSQDRRVQLQSLDPISNTFNVSLSTNDIYIPVPLEMRATVANSSQPIQQIEFYYSADINGPWELIGKHFGPDYVVYKNFDESQNGDYIKARAIDIYGNFTETPATPFARLTDNIQPTANITLSGTILGGQPVGGHEYSVNVALSDIGSGVDYALLRRNNVLISAAFNNGLLSFAEQPVAAGDTLDYEVAVFDNSGNMTLVNESFTAVPDMLPVITAVNNPTQVREQSDFTVTVSATDDLAIKQIAVEWTGRRVERNIATENIAADASFNLSDLRALRIGSTQTDILTVFVTDSFDQVTQSEISIDVVPDTAPDASQLVLDFAPSAFFGDNIRLEVMNIQNADDGEQLTVEVLEVLDSGERIIESRNNYTSDTLAAVGNRDARKNDNDQFFTKVRLTDKFGQTDETALQLTTLTLEPNFLEFVAEIDSNINPAFIEAGEVLTMATRVTDSANRPVPNQEIRWYLLNPFTDEVINFTNTAFTGSDGIAVVNEPALFKTGTYRVFAKLVDTRFAGVDAAIHVLQVLPGDPAQLVIEQLPPVLPAAELFDVVMYVEDAGGNRVDVGNSENVIININEPRFQIAFTSDVNVNYLPTQVTADVDIQSGTASIAIAASTVTGVYQLTVSYPNTVLTTLYDNDGDSETLPVPVTALDLNVVAALPTEMQLQITSVLNQQYGDEGRIEVDEVVQVELRLIDEFGNTVESTFDTNGVGTDSDYNTAISVTGNALINAASALENITMTRGVASFTVQSNTIEVVDVSLNSIVPASSGFATDDVLNIEFLKLRPHITAASFETGLDNTNPAIIFTYSEEMQLDVAADWSVTVDDIPELVNLTLDTTSLRVELTQDVLLNQCYGYNSQSLEITAVNNELDKLTQSGEVCSPHVALPVQSVSYALETRNYAIDVDFAVGITATDISNGIATVNDINQAFNWVASNVVMPDLTTLGLADGTITTVYLSGDYQSGAVRVANGISVQVLTLTGDFDGDGLSNEFEAATNTLDPTNPDSDGNGIFDGDEDTDGDGISNIDEFNAGTDPENSDTTSPTIVEIVPTDTSIDVDTESSIVVIFSEPLQSTSIVEGVITLTQDASETSGVTTLSNDGLSVTFNPGEELLGTTDYVISIQDVRDLAGNLLQVPVTSTFTTGISTADLPNIDYPAVDNVFNGIGTVIGTYDINNPAELKPLIQGNRAYVIDRNDILYILDVSSPDSPQLLGSQLLYGGDLQNVEAAVSGDYLYLTGGSDGLVIFDISDSTNIFVAAQYAGNFGAVEAVGNTVHLGATTFASTLDIIDVTDVNNIAILSSTIIGIETNVLRTTISDNYEYVLTDNSQISILEVSDPANPQFINDWNVDPARFPDLRDIAIVGDTVYLVTDRGLYIFNLADKANPVLLNLDTTYQSDNIDAVGNIVYLYSLGFSLDNVPSVLRVLDVSDPTNINLLATIEDSGAPGVVSNGLSYAVENSNFGGTLKVLDVSAADNINMPLPVGVYKVLFSSVGDVSVVGDVAYVAYDNDGSAILQLVDVTDKQNPILLSEFSEFI